MDKLILTILGTGNASVTKCYNTCFVLSKNNDHFLIDAGGGNQILKILEEENISLTDIHNMFVTHGHTDHLLGVIWVIRMISQRMNQGKYEGDFTVYCHKELEETLRTICKLTLPGKVTKNFDNRILFICIADGDEHQILGCNVKFFDIHSTKLSQYGFSLTLPGGTRLVCCGDEPYQESERIYAEGCDWMLHEAFCLYEERDIFKPYEKHHSTVKDACELAKELRVKNLILYHTEDKNIACRKERYTAEGSQYYDGNLYIPNDREKFEIV